MSRKEKQPLTFLLGKSEAVFEITLIFISYAIGIVVTVYSVTSNV